MTRLIRFSYTRIFSLRSNSRIKRIFTDLILLYFTMSASLPPQLAKLIKKYPQNHSHINLNSFLQKVEVYKF